MNGRAGIVVSVSHRRLRTADRLDSDFAGAVADTMQALATPSRVRILGRLRAGPASVNDLAAAVQMEPSAVSHQLRLLRHLGFVVGHRDGRRVVYDLYDDHVAHLLDEAVSHVEHVQLGLSGRAEARDAAAVSA
jgi:DNA-binding transcriptional ArsR family regulator